MNKHLRLVQSFAESHGLICSDKEEQELVSLLQEFNTLWGLGFRPYIDSFPTFNCPEEATPYWLGYWPNFHCFGCSKRCSVYDGTGFNKNHNVPGVTFEDTGLTANDLLSSGQPLKVKEAAFILNISERKIYVLAESKDSYLVRLAHLPVRFTSESVEAELQRTELD